MKLFSEEGWQKIPLDKSIYSTPAILQAAFHYTDCAYFHLEDLGKRISVAVCSKPGKTFSPEEFLNLLLFQQTRLQIAKDTKNLREMITARTLSSSLVVKDTPNPGTQDSNTSNLDILDDWFARNGSH